MFYVTASSLKTHRPMVSKGETPFIGQMVDLLEPETSAMDEPDQEIDLRQLRHHTKNTLQRILSLIAEAPGRHARRRKDRAGTGISHQPVRHDLQRTVRPDQRAGFHGRPAAPDGRRRGRNDARCRPAYSRRRVRPRHLPAGSARGRAAQRA